ncbi:MAG: hypothetical protein HQK73_07170, partial [Desulfamplus sp.]|nr:hypothetical protein [Desulfamplus sp.]
MNKHDIIKKIPQTSSIQYLHIAIGFTGLIVGSIIYLSDRPPESTWFVRKFLYTIGQSIYSTFPDMFVSLDKSMASFLHTFSFTMITGAFIGESKRGCLAAAMIWAVVNVLFEIGQYFDTIAVKLVPDWFEQYELLKTVDDYFIAGCFDFWDIAAIF